ncbi:2-phospho-L-lactate guanylyltransferase [Streptomyces sp. NPDC051664]|uniref:2-phospho-L-lactate guanylyltransferase n=1 Tax=Streptomyces sp. NPDC051664 TaxID=3365668 RepID=UPI003796E0E1
MPPTWTIVLPVKSFRQAKSRLATIQGAVREDLAHAFFRDTLDAVLHAHGIGPVLVVTDDQQAAEEASSLGALPVYDHPRTGLNVAIHRAATRALEGPIATLTADLPAMRSAELEQVLASAAGHNRAFLADHTQQGTTLLAALRPQWLSPSFEGNSSDRHRQGGAHEITGLEVPGIRLDVDTPDDLQLAVHLGVGRHTRGVLATALQT